MRPRRTAFCDLLRRRAHEEGLIEYRRVQGVQASEMPGLYAGADVVLGPVRAQYGPDAPAWLRTITLPQATARAIALSSARVM